MVECVMEQLWSFMSGSRERIRGGRLSPMVSSVMCDNLQKCYGLVVMKVIDSYSGQELPNEFPPTVNPTMRIYSKAAEDYSLTVRNGNVVLAPANRRDEYQVTETPVFILLTQLSIYWHLHKYVMKIQSYL